MKNVKLNNGVEMPILGFGVFQVSDLKICEKAVADAIEVGYRLFDTASVYENEEVVGNAIKKCGIKREKFFITSKVYMPEMGYENTKKSFENTLSKLKTDYLDLYLIHMPFGDYYGSWRAMEELYKEGKIKAIGVSNFTSDRIVDFCYNIKVIPAINQIEIHPFYQRDEEIELLKEYKIQAQAWAPFAEGLNGMFTNPVLSKIAKSHGKSVAQVILRFNIQRNIIVIPKSIHKERIEENFNVWDFELNSEDIKAISELDLKRPQMVDTRSVSEVRRIYGFKDNPVITSL
ncbi:aldo/keto reductase [Brachyspira sp.]|uniref:aldo/keto reductase n=1 Tax=Brachyspira sp. TaxID=1977261 RepID=UPI003D7D36C2